MEYSVLQITNAQKSLDYYMDEAEFWGTDKGIKDNAIIEYYHLDSAIPNEMKHI